MTILVRKVLFAAAALLSLAAGSNEVAGKPHTQDKSGAFAEPSSLIESLYLLFGKNIRKSSQIKCDASDEAKGLPSSAAGVKRYLETKLALAYLSNRSSGELDSEPFIEGQDFCVREFRISEQKTDGPHASLVVHFKNNGEPQELKYGLVKQSNGWVVFDVTTNSFDSLRKMLNVND